MFLEFFVVCVVLCALYLIVKWRVKNKRLLELASLTPMMKGGLPFIGNALVLHGDSVHLWNAFKRLMDESAAAGGVMGLWVGPSLHYIITDPEDAVTLMNRCLEKNRYIYDMGNSFLGGSLINAGGMQISHQPKTSATGHRAPRSTKQPTLRRPYPTRFTDLMQEIYYNIADSLRLI